MYGQNQRKMILTELGYYPFITIKFTFGDWPKLTQTQWAA